MIAKFGKIALSILISFFSITTLADTSSPAIYQAGTFFNLMSGVYDGSTTLNNLLQHANFGLGTVQGALGELVILDGKAYLSANDSKAHLIATNIATPFAIAVNFAPTQTFTLHNISDQKDLENAIDEHLQSKNIFYAIKIEGLFKNIQIRDFDAPTKPYVPFNTWLETHQHIYTLKNLRGTVVVFRSPAYTNPISVAGYHMHFINADHNIVGHVFDLQFNQAKVSIEPINNFFLMLPNSTDFLKTTLQTVSPTTINKVENATPTDH